MTAAKARQFAAPAVSQTDGGGDILDARSRFIVEALLAAYLAGRRDGLRRVRDLEAATPEVRELAVLLMGVAG